MRILLCRIFAIILFALFLDGCAGVESLWPHRGERGYGPPPHAPAHGYRHKHKHGVEMVFDSGLGVYVVTGHPSYYFSDSHYYRANNNVWEISIHLEGPWTVVSDTKVPPGLRKIKGKKIKKQGWKSK